MKALFLITALALGAFGCSGSDSQSDADYESQVTVGVQRSLLSEIQSLHQAAEDLRAAAPTPADRGWSETLDADSITAMRSAWLRARSAYERVEGALAPLFPDIDTEIDARYEDFLETLGGQGDQDLFDAQGVVGMHAIERILFADSIPPSVLKVEQTLPGYAPPAWPETPEDASDFRSELCTKLVSDTELLFNQWKPQRIDVRAAFTGLIDLMNEQREKVNKAASEEEESRYAQRTMADIRDNLAGTRQVYRIFREWIRSKPGGEQADADVEQAFADLGSVYASVSGDAFPAPPDDWSSEHPTEDALKTPFGELFTAVRNAVDPNRSGSAVDVMTRCADLLGFQN